MPELIRCGNRPILMNTMRVPAAAAAALLTLTSCGDASAHRPPVSNIPVSASPAVSTVSIPPRSSPSPPPSDSGFAEGTQPSQGPLVFVQVIDWVGADQGSHTGVTFHLTEHCAYLQGPPDSPVLLIWPDKQAWVDPASPSTVQFREPDSGKLVRLTDGQTVNLGGFPVGGQGYTYDPPPHPSCPTNNQDFVVQEVR
ncbi:hypothetical protein AB0M02_06170 [Actinoplanes sp. NPDC051861]|uniref:hypothetical protein n=1 Tax=Actinoplanes sp. NPDC051861 TaxID=3155170 RepID=UPI00342FBC71